MLRRTFRTGDRVVYCRMRHKTQPGRRARAVQPARHGDDYSYYVEKFWVVLEVRDDGQLLLQTPRGKRHWVDADDPKLRHASWIERIRYRDRFQRSEMAGHVV